MTTRQLTDLTRFIGEFAAERKINLDTTEGAIALGAQMMNDNPYQAGIFYGLPESVFEGVLDKGSQYARLLMTI